MEWIDTHAHLFDPCYASDLSEVLAASKAAGVTHICLPNLDLASLPLLIACTQKHPEMLRPMIGLHPCQVGRDVDTQLVKLEHFWEALDWVAVGEIGLDFYHDTTHKKEQYRALEKQLQWATDRGLPVALHARGAIDALIEVMKDYPTLQAVFHCFEGNARQAQQLIEHGWYMGIGGLITRANSQFKSVLSTLPLTHLVLETDAPYLAPMPYRGKRNTPEWLPIIAKRLAEIKGCTLSEVAEATTRNAQRLFCL